MKPSLITRSVLFAALAGTSLGATAADRWNHIGGGFYDFGDNGFYLEGSARVADRFVVNAEVADTFDTIYRIGGKFLTNFEIADNAPVYISAGVSDYNVDDGIYFGAGAAFTVNREMDGFLELQHDTAVNGFYRFMGGVNYAVADRTYIKASYSANTDSVSNEFRIGVSYRF